MTWLSTVPAAVDGLLRAFTVAPGLEDVQVRDGPAVASQSALRVLSVGWSAVGDVAVESQSAPDGLAGNRSMEDYIVRCTAAVLTGGTDVKAARDAVYALFDAACGAITRDPRLGGAVTRAYAGGHSLVPEQTDRGTQLNLTFEVNIEAFTTR